MNAELLGALLVLTPEKHNVMCIGQKAKLTLKENITTGYRWQCDEKLLGDGRTTPFELTVDRHVAPQNTRGMVGVPGHHEWEFVPHQTGQFTLGFVYRRPWEQPSADNQVTSVTIDVQPCAATE